MYIYHNTYELVKRYLKYNNSKHLGYIILVVKIIGTHSSKDNLFVTKLLIHKPYSYMCNKIEQSH